MWVKIRTTPQQRDEWFAKANERGISFSDFARQSMNGVVVRKRRGPRPVDPALLLQLARLGNNLNLLARWANRDQRYADRLAILSELVSIERELKALRQLHGVADAH